MRKVLLGSLLALTAIGGTSKAWADSIETSTADNPTWYRIYTPNRSNLTVTSRGAGAAIKNTAGATTPYSANMLFRFEQNTDGSYVILSMDGTYISTTTSKPSGASTNVFTTTSTKPSAGWTIAETGTNTDLYTVVNGTNQWNISQDAPNYYLYNWGSGTNTSDAGCQFRFEKQTLTDLQEAQALALNDLNNTVEGNNPGQYPADARTAFKTAITSATTTDEITAAKETYAAAMVNVVAGKTYYIVSGPSKDYCQGKYLYVPGSEQQALFANKVVAATYAWTFEDAGDGKFYLKNYSTKEYVEPNSTNANKTGNTTMSKTASTKYTIKSLGEYAFNIIPDNWNPLHAQEYNSCLVMWEGELNTASAWRFEIISDEELAAAPSISSASVSSGTQNYAPGNTDQVLFMSTLNVTGFNGDINVNSVTVDFSSNTSNAAADLENIKVYKLNSTDFVCADDARSTTLLGTLASVSGTTATITFDTPLACSSGSTKLVVAADIKSTATVGDSIDAALTAIGYGTDKSYAVTDGNPEGIARIYDVMSQPFKSYDLGSHYWRIPAMVILKHQQGDNASKNGRIVTMADNRFAHNGDLPNHIDVYERHSDDNGKTWTDHKLVAGSDSDHKLVGVAGNGFGDAALVETSKGRLIAIMVAGQYYFSSTNDRNNCNLPFIITSDDAGETWTTPRDLYSELYNGTYEQGQVLGSFAGSGRGIVLQRQKVDSLNGRVMFAMSHRFKDTGIQEYIIYTDDEGETWKMSPKSAYNGGDESKLVELADGTVMISVRQSGNRGFNTSTDGGMTWGTQTTNSNISGNACNADILYYNKHVLLHSYVNNGSRKNLTVKASFDNGKTWGNGIVICAPSSCYSTMDLTKDGKVAILYEDASCSTGFALTYASFPIDWIVPGGDPSKLAFETAVAKAQTIAESTGYTDVTDAKAGQYSQDAIDAVKASIPADTEAVTDYDAATEAIEAAIAAYELTLIAIDGYPMTTTFTISSYETIASDAPYALGADGKAAAGNTTEWQLVPLTGGQVGIKVVNAETDTYFQRSSNSTATSSSAYAWTLTKGDGDYYYIKSSTNGGTYLVIRTSDGSLNFWSNTTGTDTWSTKWVFTKKGTITGIDGAQSDAKAAPVRYYDLNGRLLKAAPAHGVYITSDHKKHVVK